MTPELQRLARAVQGNCDRSDARHAQDMSLCNYLLAMREYYRWESGLPLAADPDRKSVRDWIARREARWQEIDGESLEPLPLADGSADPFAIDEVNARLMPQGWVYGAARGPFGKPHFFLGQLAGESRRGDVRVLEVGAEVARDIDAAPAALVGSTVVLRTDAFERWLWSSTEAWGQGHETGAMRAALAAYGYENDRADALGRMAREQRETLLLHELGEHAAGLALGAAWENYFERLQDRRREILARAVRDLLADCLVTLPAIAARRSEHAAHFWFATFGGMRRTLFPRLQDAYRSLREVADWSPLEEAIDAGRAHWERTARALVREAADRSALFEPERFALA